MGLTDTFEIHLENQKQLPKDVYGAKDKKKKNNSRKRKSTAAGSKMYILMNANRNEKGIERLNLLCEHELLYQGLLMTIYALILLNKGKIYELELMRQLEKVGMRRRHDEFGDVSKLITGVFCKQQYLNRTKKKISALASQSDDEQYEITIGKRGACETTRAKIYMFLNKVPYLESLRFYFNRIQQALDREPDPMQLEVFRMEKKQEEDDVKAVMSQRA